jgi:hypothetical protein
MKQQEGGALNCGDLELCTYLQDLAEGFLPTYYSATSPSAQLKSMSIASRSYQHGKKMVVFHGFPSLEMSRDSTDDHGEELLMSYRAAFPAKTSRSPEKEQESAENGADSGEKWRELSVRYDPDTSSWKTHRCLFPEVLPSSSVTLPRWGMMRDGELWERATPARLTCGTASGLWPTPTAQDAKNNGGASQQERNTMPLNAQVGGSLNPTWVEWLMGWPLGWTDLKPSEMDRFQQWLQSHGEF